MIVEEWISHDMQTQRGVLRFMAHNDDRREAREGIMQGIVGLHRLVLRRVGFDEAVQSALVAAGKKQAGAADGDGSDWSDGDAYG
jgi:nucleolar pre-ribosomal-associated protein 1